VRVWRIEAGEEASAGRLVHVLEGPARQVWKVAYSPDGSRLAAVSADGTGQIWDADSGRAALMLRGHADEVWAVAFGANGRTLLTGSWDGTLRVWGLSAAELSRRGGGLGGMALDPVPPAARNTPRPAAADGPDPVPDDIDEAIETDDELNSDFEDDPDDFFGSIPGEIDHDDDDQPSDGGTYGRDSCHGGCSRGGCTR